jgi:hypothetical protein
MTGFIKTPADEKKWQAIKHSVAKQRGKKIEDFTDRDWATVNGAWHKSEGNIEKFEEIVKSLSTKVPSVAVPNPAKVGSTAVKMPKSKKLADPFGKPSLFFKSEDVKQPSIQKLRDFLEQRHGKR